MPSEWYDNFPNVILESFAYKKAVIATDFGSLPELVHNGETGLTFRYADSNELIEKVGQLYKEPNQAKLMGEKAYQNLVSMYSPDTHYKTLITLFNQIVKK